MATLIEKVIVAYGGEKLWRDAHAIETVVSATGGLMLWKRGRPIPRTRAYCEIHRPYVRLGQPTPTGATGTIFLDGHATGREDENGRQIERRENAREYFNGWNRRTLWWDDLDFAYFAGYALWNYLTLPALLMRTDIAWRETGPVSLEAIFPDELPTHSRANRFEFDPEFFLLRDYYYTADVVGPGWAHARHRVLSHENRGGIPWPYRRRVLLRLPGGWAPPVPAVMDIRLENCAFMKRPEDRRN